MRIFVVGNQHRYKKWETAKQFPNFFQIIFTFSYDIAFADICLKW